VPNVITDGQLGKLLNCCAFFILKEQLLLLFLHAWLHKQHV